MNRAPIAALFAIAAAQAQPPAPAIDRAVAEPLSAVRIERGSEGSFADSFQLGRSGDVWMIDAIRVWAIPASGASCGTELGDSIEKITLLGAMDNPPVPGQPVCDCHALVALATAPLRKGSSATTNPNVAVTRKGGIWQLDFKNVRWSVPGGGDILFTARVTPRAGSVCHAATDWSLAGAPASGHRLHLLNEKGVPVGLAEPAAKPLQIGVQVWAKPVDKNK